VATAVTVGKLVWPVQGGHMALYDLTPGMQLAPGSNPTSGESLRNGIDGFI
jgi:hypothetical protein